MLGGILAMSAGLALAGLGRIRLAKMAIQKHLGHVPQGAARYRQVCPPGAGLGPKRRPFAEQGDVGGVKASRLSRKWAKQFSSEPWAWIGRASERRLRLHQQGYFDRKAA